MKSASTAPELALEAVATASPYSGIEPRPCERCGRPLPNARRGRRFCSDRCRWARWKEGRDREMRDALERIRAEVDALLAKL